MGSQDELDMNEAETRTDCILPALRAAGWGVVEGSRVREGCPITLGRLEGQVVGGAAGAQLQADDALAGQLQAHLDGAGGKRPLIKTVVAVV